MKALIMGISGQDGAYLAQHLLALGHQVVGTSRDVLGSQFKNLKTLGIADQIESFSVDTADFRSVLKVLDDVRPDQVYNLSGLSSVSLSYEQPVETMESIAKATLNTLEAIRVVDPSIRFFSSGSSDCFGDTGSVPATETMPFSPKSPYGIAKTTAHYLIKTYRETYGLFACTGILFNHESPLRPTRFVTQKIVTAAARISAGSQERLALGNLGIARDWGWAPDYVKAMDLMLAQDSPEDVVVATGVSTPLKEFVSKSFGYFDLDWEAHVDIEARFMRPSDIETSLGDPTRAQSMLGWSPSVDVDGVIERMCQAAKERVSV